LNFILYHTSPTGSIAPRVCSTLASCPEGSGTQVYYGGFLICFLIDIALAAIIGYLHYRDRQLRMLNTKSSSKKHLSIPQHQQIHPQQPQQQPQLQQQQQQHLQPNLSSSIHSSSIPRIQSSIPMDTIKSQTMTIVNDGDLENQLLSSNDPYRRPTLTALAVQENMDIGFLVNAFKKKESNTLDDFKIRFQFENVGLKLPDGREVLKGVTGEIVPGRLTAIMGPSGAGSK